MGFTMAAQVTGKGPLAALGEHLNDPINTTIFSKCEFFLQPAVMPQQGSMSVSPLIWAHHSRADNVHVADILQGRRHPRPVSRPDLPDPLVGQLPGVSGVAIVIT